jgi:hypothetical protein
MTDDRLVYYTSASAPNTPSDILLLERMLSRIRFLGVFSLV